MNEADIRATTLATLQSIAPEVEVDALRSDRPLRRQVDLDSMDWLNFLLGINKQLKVEIPEVDYSKLATIDDIVAYIAKKLAHTRVEK